jgi:LemA protein
MKRIAIVILVLAGAAVLLVLKGVSAYNGLVSVDEEVKRAWAQVENQLQRRYDLIPSLVTTVERYAAHEQAVFTEIADARARLAGAATVADKVGAANDLEGVLGRLLAIAEGYPELKASENFRGLQDELAGTENRIAVERMRYNESVQTYNVTARSFPTVLVVRILGFDSQKAFFEAESDLALRAPAV